ncbi:MAG: VCBS repeat-containing protein [Nitrospira sp.]|nr:VCBS repeat-containing protein [Nitrospira sp.]
MEQHPRFVADLTGDGKADIIGFGHDGVWVALNNGSGGFHPAQFVLQELGYNQGWRVEQHPRFVADLTGDGKADIIGFGHDGVWVALNNGSGGFHPAQFVLQELATTKAGGWSSIRGSSRT